MKRIVLPAAFSFLAGIAAAFAQAIPTTTADFSALFNQAIFMFVLFYGFIMILVGWVYMHTKNRPVEVVPIQPKTLAILGGISGVFVVLAPTGLIPEELSTPFFMLVGAMLFIMFIGVIMDIAVFRGKEKEAPEEAAADIVAAAGLRGTRQEARVEAAEEKEELEEEDTLKKIVRFLHVHPKTREFLEGVFSAHQKEFSAKYKKEIPSLMGEIHALYKESRDTLAQEKGATELEAADILIAKGEAMIQAHESDDKLQAEMKKELRYIKTSVGRIINAIKLESEKLELKKNEEQHILEDIMVIVRATVGTVETELKTLGTHPKGHETEIRVKREQLASLIEFEKLLEKLTSEIILEEHYLAQQRALREKMKRMESKIYRKEGELELKEGTKDLFDVMEGKGSKE